METGITPAGWMAIISAVVGLLIVIVMLSRENRRLSEVVRDLATNREAEEYADKLYNAVPADIAHRLFDQIRDGGVTIMERFEGAIPDDTGIEALDEFEDALYNLRQFLMKFDGIPNTDTDAMTGTSSSSDSNRAGT